MDADPRRAVAEEQIRRITEAETTNHRVNMAFLAAVFLTACFVLGVWLLMR